MLIHKRADRNPENDHSGSGDSYFSIISRDSVGRTFPYYDRIGGTLLDPASTVQPGDWLVTEIIDSKHQTLIAKPLYKVAQL